MPDHLKTKDNNRNPEKKSKIAKWLFLTLLFCGFTGLSDVQKYPVTEEKQKINTALVAANMKTAPSSWKNAPLVYYTIPPLSPSKRLPDTFPSDGNFLAPLSFIAAQGEFEPASIVVYPFKKVKKLELRASDLHSKNNTIAASALDIKIVKVWYQAGSAWYGYFTDRTQRTPIPELLLNDETLVKVDHRTKDNYVRYKCLDGPQRYAWMSFSSAAVNHKYDGQAKLNLISDSPTLLPALLYPGEFKQFFVTLHVPAKATPGVYRGSIALIADGNVVGNVPIKLRVLPFQLPRPATYYDINKEFYGSIYCQPLRLDCPKILKNLSEHNILNPLLPRPSNTWDSKAFLRMIIQLKAAGLSTKPLFAAGPYAKLMVDEPPTPAQKSQLNHLRKLYKAAANDTKKHLGHKEIYSYAYDEGGASKIRKERAVWRAVHQAESKVMVTSYPHGRFLFNLDYLIIPGMPVEKRKKEVDMWHNSNPGALVSWYANPHSGPENPDYFRRIHGMMAYKSNYDAISNYVWYRNNWNDFWVPAEAVMRGLTIVYPTNDDVIDTLAWEGMREGLDDIRYATKLRQLALKALKSKNTDINYAGRKALSWLAHWDESREDLNSARLEMVNYILTINTALKGNK